MQARVAIYLDSNAGAPLSPRAQQALLSLLSDASAQAGHGLQRSHPFFPLIPNPSSTHAFGRKAKKLLEDARAQIAQSLGQDVHPSQITFTSSGTEANQSAIRQVL